jgi:hypothetical protein
VALVALLSDAAVAQRFGGGFGRGNIGMLAGQESVRQELKLSEEQIAKLDDQAETIREKFRDAFSLEGEERTKKIQELTQENEKAVAEILKPEQMKRLKQISYQQQGAAAFRNAEVAKALELSDEQKEQIQKINEDTLAQMRELFQGGGLDDEGRKKLEELRKDAADKADKLLTDKQRTAWKELQGAPFKGEIRPFRKKQ